MSQASLVSSPAEPTGPVSTSATRLSGRWLVLARGLWIAVALLSTALFAAGLPIALTAWQRLCTRTSCLTLQLTAAQARILQAQGLSLSLYMAFWVGMSVLLALGFMLMGALIFWRRSDDWLALMAACALMTNGPALTSVWVVLFEVAPVWLLPVDCLAFLSNVCFILFFFLLPTGWFAPRWSPWVAALVILNSASWDFFRNTPLDTFTWPQPYWTLVWVGVNGSQLGVVLYRFRSFLTPIQRQQVKWVVVGSTVGLAGNVGVDLFLNLTVPGTAETGFTTLPLLGAIVLLYLSFLLTPLSFGMAILRSHLWEIDTLINKALVYGSLTALLGALYAGLIIGFERLAGLLGGTAAQNPAALVISTLVIAALFLPVRRRLQQVIDQRFYRKKYDAEQTLADFSATLREAQDLQQIQAQMLAVVQETMQPEHISLWLRPLERPHAPPWEPRASGQRRAPTSALDAAADTL